MMSNYLSQETTRVSGGPWSPVDVARTAENWDLGSAGYAEESVVTVVEYPDQASMEAADRPLGFGVAMASAVEIVSTGQEQ